MGLVLNQDYGFTAGGLARFAVNRWLRLFPIYYAVIGTTALYILFIGQLNQLNQAIALPSSGSSIFANFSIVTLTSFDFTPEMQRLAPTTWSLAIEIFCYFLLATFFARSQVRLSLMLAIGTGIAVVQIVGDIDLPDYGFQNHYSVLQAGMIPFALGGLAYFNRDARICSFSGTKLALLGLLFLANFVLGYWSDFHKYVSGLYVAAALNVALVPMLFTRPSASHWQKVLGGLSYPIFLCHWLIGTLIAVYSPAFHGQNFIFFASATVGSVLFGLLLYYCIDRPLQAIRAAVKRRSLALSRNSLEIASGT
jgi:peptidoglycan/LPS O-acetylase OafA/YrhL